MPTAPHAGIPCPYPAGRAGDLTLAADLMKPTTQNDPQNELWQRMLTVVRPYVAVARATRPCAITKPPPIPVDVATDPRFDSSE
jgi:NADH:ubiquinone oxidoreductase subunit H